MKNYSLYINGASAPPASDSWFESENPYTRAPWAVIARGNAQDVDKAVSAAHAAFTTGEWSTLTASQRGMLLHRLGDLVSREARNLAATEVQDNGKLFAEMHGQLAYIPQWFYYFGGLADKVAGSVLPIDKKGYFSFTRHEALGVVGVITPWNSPLLLLAWKLAPALAAGCTVVIKPSEFTSASTLEFARLFEEAGFPPGVVNVVTGFGDEVGVPLVSHPLVRKISFTGSDATGRQIGAQTGRDLKRVSLELGGKSPNIVFSDANLGDAVNGVVAGIFAATGQTCIAGSRLLLQDEIYDAFVERLLALVATARMGDPMRADTQVGPVTTEQQYRKILGYIDIAMAEGAKLLTGGRKGASAECGSGRFIEPTIFGDVKNNMCIAQEEVFGPVLSIIRFTDEDHAIELANDSRFGLGAGVWTSDMARAIRMSERIQSGTVWINTYRAVSFMAPFGGFKDSGLGRENGAEAICEYLQTKTVWINSGAATGNPFVLR